VQFTVEMDQFMMVHGIWISCKVKGLITIMMDQNISVISIKTKSIRSERCIISLVQNIRVRSEATLRMVSDKL
jgi:hypothetical protein